MQADALARRGVSDKNGAYRDNILYLCIPRLISKHPARLRRGFPAYPGPLLCTTTLRLVPTVSEPCCLFMAHLAVGYALQLYVCVSLNRFSDRIYRR